SRVKQRHGIGGVLRHYERSRITWRTEASPCDLYLIREGFGESCPRPTAFLIFDGDGHACRKNSRTRKFCRTAALCHSHVNRRRDSRASMRSAWLGNIICIRRSSEEKNISTCVDRSCRSLRDGSVNLRSC